jgi:hypothetical protein
MFTKPSFTYFEITSHPNTFCKNNPRFFCNYKNTLFTYTLNFRKLHINTHKLYTNIYFTLTKYLPSITNTRTVTELNLDRALRKTLIRIGYSLRITTEPIGNNRGLVD